MKAWIEKIRYLGKDVLDNSRTAHLVAPNKGKEPIIPDDINTPVDNELSSGSSPSMNLSSTKNAQKSTKMRSRMRPLPHLAFSDAVSGASRKARRKACKRQNQPDQALRNPPVIPSSSMPPIPPVHPAFGAALTFYMLPIAIIRRPDDMLSSPLGQHILDYEPPHEFVIPTFTTFDGSTDPYDHMLHYNHAMTLNAGNDWLL